MGLVHVKQPANRFHDIAVAEVVGKMPIDALGYGPFAVLREVLPHEEQLLARVANLVRQERLQAAVLLLHAAGRFLDERFLSVHDLVVREHEHEVLGKRVVDGVHKQFVVVLAVDGVFLDEAQRVVHPAHIPFQGEPERIPLVGRGNAPFGRRVLADEVAGRPFAHRRVQLAHEIHALQVQVTPEHVGAPLAAAVVQVNHRRHRIDAQRIDVELVYPVKRARNEKRAHLGLAVVEGHRAPLRILRAERIGRLVKRRAVEVGQAELVFGIMRRHPIKNDADSALVQLVDEIAEVVGHAIARRGRKVTGNLVAPRQVEGVFANAHELYMRVAHEGCIFSQVVRVLAVVQIAVLVVLVAEALLPRAKVHLVNGHGLFENRGIVPLRLIVGIAPLVAFQAADDGRVGRAQLASKRVGIGLVAPCAIGPGYDEAIRIAFSDMGKEHLPNAAVASVHGVLVIPSHTRRYHRYGLGIGSPHRKARSRHAEHRIGMRPELLVCLVVRPLVEQVTIVVGEESHVSSSAILNTVSRIAYGMGEAAIAICPRAPS